MASIIGLVQQVEHFQKAADAIRESVEKADRFKAVAEAMAKQAELNQAFLRQLTQFGEQIEAAGRLK